MVLPKISISSLLLATGVVIQTKTTTTTTAFLLNNNNNNNNNNRYDVGHHAREVATPSCTAWLFKCTSRGGSSEEDEDEYDVEDVVVPTTMSSSGGTSEFAVQCEAVKSEILDGINKEIEEMKKTVLDNKECIPSFGIRCEELCNRALEEFASKAPSHNSDDITDAITYDKKLEELEDSIDTPLEVLYMKQLNYLREKALQTYKQSIRTSPSSDYEAMLNADTQFERNAEDMTRDGSTWDYSNERTHLQTIMNELASSGKKLNDVQMKNAQQQSTAMQFLQQQQQMIQQLQMQLYGQTSPWNVGVAYRIPDTNFNIQGAYQQGRTNLQISCIPDEYASLLGPNGFTSGVGPGNLGLSLNLSI